MRLVIIESQEQRFLFLIFIFLEIKVLNHYKKISSFSTRLSILYILDVLYTCYFKLDYQENIEKKLAYYNNIVEGTIK